MAPSFRVSIFIAGVIYEMLCLTKKDTKMLAALSASASFSKTQVKCYTKHAAQRRSSNQQARTPTVQS